MLRYSLLSAGLMLGASAFAAPAGDLPLMPWPAKVERPAPQGALVINDNISVSVTAPFGMLIEWMRFLFLTREISTLAPPRSKRRKSF